MTHVRVSVVVASFAAALAIGCSGGACTTTVVAPSEVSSTDMLAATSFDTADWTHVVTTYVDDKGEVDYPRLLRERERLDRYVALIAVVGPTTKPALFPTPQHRLAYFINAYNALTMFNVVNRYPAIQSVTEDQLSFFVTTKFRLDGGEINLYDLENKVVRPTFKDARVHFALNCASAGCPILPAEPFLPETLEGQLAREETKFLHEPRNVAVEDGVVVLSNIFDWYKDDFGGDPVGYIRARAPDLNLPDTKDYQVRPYGWALNDQTR